MSWNILKKAITDVIKTNGNEEITGQNLQNTLVSMVNALGDNSTFVGFALPTTNPGNPDGPVFYLANVAGVYSNFSGYEVKEGEAVVLNWDGSGNWSKHTLTTGAGGLNSDIKALKERNNAEIPVYSGVVESATIKSGSVTQYSGVYFIKSEGRFAAKQGSEYFANWLAYGGYQAQQVYHQDNKAVPNRLYNLIALIGGGLHYFDGTSFKVVNDNAGVEEAIMLLRNVLGGNAQVIEWSHTHNMNDYKEAGTYRIKGERTGNPLEDNLPIMNQGSGHTIEGILYVLDSSLANGSGNQYDCTITQFLMLSNRVGGQEGDMYMRSAYGANKDSLTWKPWEKFQTNIEVSVVNEKVTELESEVIYDVTANNSGVTFASLSALLSDENLSTLIPSAVKCGGMSIRFVQSSDNEYVQYFYRGTSIATADFTNTANWQGVDAEPIYRSKNLIESGGVFNFPVFATRHVVDFNNAIQELYVNPEYVSETDYLSIRYHEGSHFVCAEQGGLNRRFACRGWHSHPDRVIVPLQVTTSYDENVPLGTIVGYVIFKDIYYFINNPSCHNEFNVNTKYVLNSHNSPLIFDGISKETITTEKIANNAVTTEKIANNAVTEEKLSNDSITTNAIQNYAITLNKLEDKFIKVFTTNSVEYDIRGMISELYLKTNSVVFNDAEGYTELSIKVYNTSLYIRPFNRTTTYGWTSILPLTNCENNVPYELKVSKAGVNSLYAVGDTVGCIIFKDIATLKTKIFEGNATNGIRDNVINPDLSPVAYQYLANPQIDISGVLKCPELQIPTDLYVVANNRLMLFYKSIVKSYNSDIYGLRIVCSVGKAYPKYYVLDATNTGDYSITFNVVDKDDNIVSSKTSTIHVISAMSTPSANKNILVFGASTMADGSVTGELKRRLTESSGDGTTQNPTGLGLNNITFVGRKRGSNVNVNQEATGGWSWKNYSTEGQLAYRFNVNGVNQLNINDTYTCNGVTLTIAEINVTSGSGNIRCTYSGTSTLPASGTLTRSSGSGDSTIAYTSYDSESYNPFWNPNKTGGAGLDFTNYANEYCNGSIDVMIACCGYNDFNRYTPETISNLFIDYVKPFIRAYHTDFPNGKFIIGGLHIPTPDGGIAANYGASSSWNWLTTSCKVWAFEAEAEKLVKESEFSSYVSLADVTSEFDCEHSYPTAQAYVNNRSSEQETVTTNGIHFTAVGAYQVSDSLYHTFNNLSL